MANKEQKTIFIKQVRSGIGFSHKQKRQIRSLGFSKLNQVVERPDTPQIRGLVNSIPHLVKIVKEPRAAAWASTPEYVIKPAEAAATASTGEEKQAPLELEAPDESETLKAAGTEFQEHSASKPADEPEGQAG